jgi:hypothetical protein
MGRVLTAEMMLIQNRELGGDRALGREWRVLALRSRWEWQRNGLAEEWLRVELGERLFCHFLHPGPHLC